VTPHLSPATVLTEASSDISAGRPTGAADGRTGVNADDSATPRTAASTTSADTLPGTGRQPRPASRPATSPTARDDLDADLLKAIRNASTLRQAFYILVLLIALAGQVSGAVHSLNIPLIVAIPAVAALELGGVVVMANADVRRRLGEHALASRILSAAIAAGAVTFNWFAHPDRLEGGFYSFMSALGYLVWLMHAGNQRRDRLRATGDLPPTPPAYEMFGHWIRHPVITARARSIAKADGLDLYESLKAARAAIHREHRDAAIAKVLHRKIRAAVDPTTADIAVRVYDLDEIASRLAATADYNGLTALLAADLVPEQILAATSSDTRRRRRWSRRRSPVPAPPVSQPSPSISVVLTQPTTGTGAGGNPLQPARKTERDPRPAKSAPLDEEEPTTGEDTSRRQDVPVPDDPPAAVKISEPSGHQGEAGAERYMNDDDPNEAMDEQDPEDEDPEDDDPDDDDDPETPTGTADAVAYWLSRNPDMDLEVLAEKIGKSLRSVYRYLPPDYPRKPGLARSRARQSPTRLDDSTRAGDESGRGT
jgi:hypothetical protein